MMQPNILVFFTDQQRWDTVGCHNPAISTTPVLDQLAREGVKFENAFTVQPVCGPARSCLQTGRYPTQNGCYRNNIAMRQDEVTLAKLFNQAGYDTAYIGKWHLADLDEKPVPEELRGGWQYWLAADALEHTSHPYGGHFFDNDNQSVHFDGYRVDDQTTFALDYLKNRQRDNPFLLFLSYLEPHFQNDMARFVAPDGYAERFQTASVPPDLINRPGDWPQNLPDYYGMCQNLDENLGRIVDYLKSSGEYDNTIILFFSDHGCHFRTRNDEYKRSCHESSIRIPCVARGGPFSGGRTVEHLVTLLDIPVTMLSAAGITVPDAMVGRDLQTALDTEHWDEEVLIQISESEVGRALRTPRWKYEIVAPGSDPWNEAAAEIYVESQLYDLLNDPWERQNLIASPEHARIREKLRQDIGRKMTEIGEDLPVIVPVE